MIEAGRLRHIVEIQDFTTTQNSSGDDVRSYFVFATRHVEIVTGGGRELFAAQQQFAEASAVIKGRYLAGINARMRVYHRAEDTYYDIVNARPDDQSRRADMILICKTGASDEA